MRSYLAVLRTPGAWRFYVPGFFARLPNAMFSSAITLMIVGYFREYRVAGVVTAVATVANAIAAPIVGRLFDRYGQRRIGRPLIGVFALSAGGLVAVAATHRPVVVLCLFAACTGAAAFPVGSLVRSRWSTLHGRSQKMQSAFSLESMFDDVAFTVAPTVATTLATVTLPLVGFQPAAGVVTMVALLLVAGLIFLAQRDTEPEIAPGADRASRSAILCPGVLLVTLVFLGVGIQFGSNNITMVAMCEQLGATWLAGPIMACGSVASMLGALFYGARHWVTPLWKRFVIGVVILAGAGLLFLTAHSYVALAMVSFLAGASISPSFVNGNAMIQRLVPATSLTEGLTWIGTSLGVGIAAGASLAGHMVDSYGAHSGYWVLSGGAVVALAIALASARSLRRHSVAAAVASHSSAGA